MHKINIMLSSRPRLLSDVMRNLIERQPDMIIVGDVIDPIKLIFALQVTPADVVIITPHKANGAPRICDQLLKEYPKLTILILTQESESVYIFKSGLHRKRIERPSEQIIIDVIRESLSSVTNSI
jgi:DNA-binding NarL/FixJ family response regulator